MVRESLNPNRALSIPTCDIKDHYARYRFCDLRDAGSLSIQSEIQKRRTDRASHTHAHAQAAPFNIPVAGGEPITLALKYGNRATGSAYRRLDKRCDARSIGPPTDRGASALARSRAPLFFILLLSVPPSCTRSARNHLLCTWLEADCYPGILPFLRPAVHIARRSRVPPSPGRTWSLRMRAEYSASDRGT